jgi:Kyakuja-Dileera-Zisupton transposase
LDQGATSSDYADLVDICVLLVNDPAVDIAVLADIASERRPFRVAVDGAMKFTRYRSCGSTHTSACSDNGYGPMVSTYFGSLNEAAERLIYDVRQDTATNTVVAAEATSCGANLRYAREYGSKATVLLDDKCVAGMVCDHVVPGVDLFISSSSHENYRMMDFLLGGVLADRMGQPIDVFCFDVACRYKLHVPKDHPALADSVKHFAVGWVHANAGHGLDCQLNNSAMYKPGTGRCNGEWTELLWVGASGIASVMFTAVNVNIWCAFAGWDEALGPHHTL